MYNIMSFGVEWGDYCAGVDMSVAIEAMINRNFVSSTTVIRAK